MREYLKNTLSPLGNCLENRYDIRQGEWKKQRKKYGLNGEVLGKNEEYVNYDVYKDFKKGAEKTTKLCAIKFNGKYYRVIEK